MLRGDVQLNRDWIWCHWSFVSNKLCVWLITACVRHWSGSVLVMRCLWVSHVCHILNLLRVTSRRLDKGMEGYGWMVVFILLSLLWRFDHMLFPWFMIIFLVTNLMSWWVSKWREMTSGGDGSFGICISWFIFLDSFMSWYLILFETWQM